MKIGKMKITQKQLNRLANRLIKENPGKSGDELAELLANTLAQGAVNGRR